MLEKKLIQVGEFIKLGFDSVLTIAKVIAKSGFNVKLTPASQARCSILGNGPSLKQSLENHLAFIKSTEMVCVNNFTHSSYFVQLKPQSYALLDPAFFMYDGVTFVREDIGITLTAFSKVDWPMNVFIPMEAKKSAYLSNIFQQNANLKPVYYNYTVIQGFSWFRHWLFKKNLGMQQSQNILAVSIFLSLNRGFKETFVFGADHSWHEQLTVVDNNDLVRKDVHFYDEKEVKATTIIDVVHNQSSRMSDQFMSLSKAFYSYEVLETYAKHLNLKVYNASAKSYIDAFERIRLS
ncbi:hypothetical protein NF867_08690 [Solitalea sp. MAHUQ-68]|uniref:Uncharacterized protein n=1 Tax=Solitalea agri TaxID=2953739 RepID=A0A9X2F5W0_9SPHI|nr:hypothetical protein [Solitalea agri]MCO4292936.1 hypothetical protein [Solitalea agri]